MSAPEVLTGPVVRVDLELGTYAPIVDEEDKDWRPVEYAVRAHHAAKLTHDATTVTERVLERLTLRLSKEYDDEADGPTEAELELPATIEGLEALIGLLDHARDYLAQERTP